MKFKLDENIGSIGAEILAADGHEVSTVSRQGLSGVGDGTLFEICKGEGRVLVTLDRDFGEVLRFPPAQTPGIVVLSCHGRLSPGAIRNRIKEFADMNRSRSIDKELWIVEPGRVRIHRQYDDD
jgi:predicted nuclease of predicted toxin-antitoxin system